MAQRNLKSPNADMIASMHIGELMDITSRMNDLIAQEAEMLETFRYADLATLQDEKLALTEKLEAYQQLLASTPDFVKQADIKIREELLVLTDDLAYNAEDNFKKIAVARAVNQRVLQAIRDVLTEQHSPTTYGRDGSTSQHDSMTLSMNLNQKA